MSEARLEALREMLVDDPADAFSRYALAMQLKGLDRHDEALVEMATLVANNPDYVATYYHYGGLLHASGQTPEGIAIVKRGLEVAQAAGDDHAHRELEDLLDELEGSV